MKSEKANRHGLPEQYAHFTRLRETKMRYTTQLRETREQDRFNQVYEDAWITLCMAMDTKMANNLRTSLKKEITGVTDPKIRQQKKRDILATAC